MASGQEETAWSHTAMTCVAIAEFHTGEEDHFPLSTFHPFLDEEDIDEEEEVQQGSIEDLKALVPNERLEKREES